MSIDSPIAVTSLAQFRAAVRESLQYAAECGATEICCVDPSFADWPLNDPEVIAALTKWIASRRRLVVFAHDFEDFGRRQHRFVEWRRTWAHVVDCRADPELQAEQVPTLLYVADAISLRLVDQVRYRGTMSCEPVALAAARETVDALLQRSTEAFPVTTLGL